MPPAAAFDARTDPPIAPYDELDFDVPVCTEGDVDARVWVRIEEVAQSLRAGRSRSWTGCRPGPIRPIPPPDGRRRARPWSKVSAASIHDVRSAVARMASSRAATRAIRPGSSGRCWKPRSRATSSPTSRSATRASTAPIPGTTCDDCEDLLLEAFCGARRPIEAPAPDGAALEELARALGRARAPGGWAARSSIREVDAGSCNGCELEIHALNNPVYDLERFGLKFVASPRHADVLLVTGPVTSTCDEALVRTCDATPEPKWVVAAGDCAVDCGVFAGSYAMRRPGVSQSAGRSAHQRLPARADRNTEGPAGARRGFGVINANSFRAARIPRHR